MESIKVCFITGSRAEYGLMRWLMEDIKKSPDFELQVIVTGSHLMEEFGNTYRQIEEDGFFINKRIPFPIRGNDLNDLGKAVGTLSSSLVESFEKLSPDLLMVMGDRYELLSVISSSVLSAIPVAHISGGELTEGAIDDQIRHAMTKISHLHYVANEVYEERVKQMGEESWRICNCGEPGLDNLQRQEIMGKNELQENLKLDLSKPTALVTYHPVTLEREGLKFQIDELLTTMENLTLEEGLQFVITYPNADEGSKLIIETWKKFVDQKDTAVLIKSLGQSRYLSALKYLTVVIGNSSSGLVEAPSFNMPVINIGNRQKGRMRGSNVIDVGYSNNEITLAVKEILKNPKKVKCFNPYGEGNSSVKILSHIKNIYTNRTKQQLMTKKFQDSLSVIDKEKNFFLKYGD